MLLTLQYSIMIYLELCWENATLCIAIGCNAAMVLVITFSVFSCRGGRIGNPTTTYAVTCWLLLELINVGIHLLGIEWKKKIATCWDVFKLMHNLCLAVNHSPSFFLHVNFHHVWKEYLTGRFQKKKSDCISVFTSYSLSPSPKWAP